MIKFPNAKINLGLRILRKRSDGYHDLETIFYPVSWTDALEMIPADQLSFQQTGLSLGANEADNLVVKAYRLLKNDFHLSPVSIHLHKSIPAGAGLGGGSADAAFSLKLFNEIFTLNLSIDQLLAYALQLGSDCPFFIHNKPCYATGRGEILEPSSVDLSAYQIVVVFPGIHCPTAQLFSRITLQTPYSFLQEIIQLPVSKWKDEMINDFEPVAFDLFPEIKICKEKLYAAGAVYASLSGSGSSVFGIFEKREVILNFPDHYLVKWV